MDAGSSSVFGTFSAAYPTLATFLGGFGDDFGARPLVGLVGEHGFVVCRRKLRLYQWGRVHVRQPWWERWWLEHKTMLLGMLPLSLWFFQQCSWVSILANTVAIPWVSFFLVPAVLIAGLGQWLMPTISWPLLRLADAGAEILMRSLAWFADWPWAETHFAIGSAWVFFSTMLAMGLFLTPRGLGLRLWGWCGCPPFF